MADKSQYVVVKLDEVELATALYAGSQLHNLSKRMGLRDRAIRRDVSPMHLTQVGMIGEMVVAKYLDVYWGGSARSYAGADLSHNIEVRTISRPENGLKVRRRDADKIVVGVILPAQLAQREFVIPGWHLGADVREEWLVDPYNAGRPYYAVPLSELRTPLDLRERLR